MLKFAYMVCKYNSSCHSSLTVAARPHRCTTASPSDPGPSEHKGCFWGSVENLAQITTKMHSYFNSFTLLEQTTWQPNYTGKGGHKGILLSVRYFLGAELKKKRENWDTYIQRSLFYQDLSVPCPLPFLNCRRSNLRILPWSSQTLNDNLQCQLKH